MMTVKENAEKIFAVLDNVWCEKCPFCEVCREMSDKEATNLCNIAATAAEVE
jgi:recombinational DNA repair protein RecR